MSTLKDVELAMNGELTPATPAVKEYVPEPVFLAEQPKQEDHMIVFKLANSNRKGGVHIPGTDHVIDPRTVTKEKPHGDGPEMIRLLNGVNTIWAKEQKNLSEDYVKKNVRTIHFPRGNKFIHVPAWDKPMIEFMKVCRHNIKNPLRVSGSKFEFFEYDPNEAAKAALEKELLEVEMVRKAYDTPEKDMIKHAVFLKISLNTDIGTLKTPGALRTDYVLAAKRDPKHFKETYGSKSVDVQYKIRAAIIDGKIDIGRESGKAFWGKGGGLICSYPKTEKPLEFLTNLALTPNQEGKDFLEQLNSIST